MGKNCHRITTVGDDANIRVIDGIIKPPVTDNGIASFAEAWIARLGRPSADAILDCCCSRKHLLE